MEDWLKAFFWAFAIVILAGFAFALYWIVAYFFTPLYSH